LASFDPINRPNGSKSEIDATVIPPVTPVIRTNRRWLRVAGKL